MNPWIEIYDNEQVQWYLRQRVTNLAAGIVASVSLAVFACSVSGMNVVPYGRVLIAIAVSALVAAALTGIRILRLRTRVWCIKLSPHMVMGYDYRRKATTLCWSDVSRINVGAEGVLIAGKLGGSIFLPQLFPDYAHISHRILDLAELHRLPVHVEGQSIADTDVFDLLPELATLFEFPPATRAASA